jgi:hypothetical protein
VPSRSKIAAFGNSKSSIAGSSELRISVQVDRSVDYSWTGNVLRTTGQQFQRPLVGLPSKNFAMAAENSDAEPIALNSVIDDWNLGSSGLPRCPGFPGPRRH